MCNTSSQSACSPSFLSHPRKRGGVPLHDPHPPRRPPPPPPLSPLPPLPAGVPSSMYIPVSLLGWLSGHIESARRQHRVLLLCAASRSPLRILNDTSGGCEPIPETHLRISEKSSSRKEREKEGHYDDKLVILMVILLWRTAV